MLLAGMLGAVIDLGGSDLHLTVGAPPIVRHNGKLTPLEDSGR